MAPVGWRGPADFRTPEVAPMPSDFSAANVPSVPGLPGRSAPLDTSLVLVSPENIAFEYRLAGPAPRALAFLIDLLLLGLLALAAGLFVGFVGQGSLAGFYLAGLFFLWWGGNAAVEVLANGQTPGKRALGIRVVSHDGLSINVSQSILRNLLRAVDLAPPLFPGVVSMVVTPRLQRLGDLASGTIVVVDRRAADAAPPVVDNGPNFIADMVPAGFVPPLALVEALADYVGRRRVLGPARRQEVAAIAAARLVAAWGTPPARDDDALLCAVYERATSEPAR